MHAEITPLEIKRAVSKLTIVKLDGYHFEIGTDT